MPDCRILVRASCVLALAACDATPASLDIDIGRYEPIPAVDDLDFGSIVPAVTVDYWELRSSMGPDSGQPDRILGAGGTVSRDELPPDVRAALDATRSQIGFALSCAPLVCFQFIAAVTGNQVTIFVTVDALRDFLGAIGSVHEAALLVGAYGFYWEDAGDHTGVRAVEDGWEFVVLELVELCAPVQTDRVLLHADRAGAVTELRREVWERNENVCI